jgi:predicted amidophosphoribosyltransferase
MTRLLLAALQLLVPQRCVICARLGEGLCSLCLGSLVRLAPPHCERCGAPGPWPVRRCAECAGRRLAFASARSALVYEQRARRFVAGWKEGGRRQLSVAAASVVAEVVPVPAAEVLTFVPGDPDRLLERGHSPPERLAQELGHLWERPVERLLRRTRAIRPQRGLDLPARRRNVAGAFVATGRSPPRVCLVDDVYTTGSTVNACASALRRAGARSVEVVALARAVR